jgi:hypothetical protein
VIAVTFFVNLPLTQVMVNLGLATTVAVAEGVGLAEGAEASCESFALITGDENSKLSARSRNQPLDSPITTVAICGLPSALTMLSSAFIGAFENP